MQKQWLLYFSVKFGTITIVGRGDEFRWHKYNGKPAPHFSLVSLENYSVSLVKVNLKLWISSVVIQSKDVMYSGFRLSKNDAMGQRFMPQVAELIMLCSLIAAIENFYFYFFFHSFSCALLFVSLLNLKTWSSFMKGFPVQSFLIPAVFHDII